MRVARSLAAIVAGLALWTTASAAEPVPLAVRITSPLGRTGSFESVRIVAQIRGLSETAAAPPTVRFLVDGVPLGEDVDGPPFAIEWIDENPFERREIKVEVVEAGGRQATDLLTLDPFEVTEVSEVAGVVLEATVEDTQGRPVTTLTEHDFEVTEDGSAQALDLIRSESLPATYVLLIDSSQSMARRIDFVKDAARRLVDYLRPDDRVLVVPFSVTLGPVTGPTADRDTIIEAIADVRATGGTAILDSIAAAAALLKDAGGRHVVVVLTDGYDERSAQSDHETLEVLKQHATTTYVVGIGGVAGVSIKGERFLKQLARQSGGRAFFPYRNSELPAVYEHIALDVRQRYILGYTPTNQRRDGGWRAITVTAGAGRLVRTRTGYFAPDPPPVRPMLEFTVSDAANRYLEISRDDLVVKEDGVEQFVDSFQEAIAPVSMVLVLDQSGSMRRAADAVKEAAYRFVGSIRKEDALGVALFADRPELVQDLTKDREEAIAAIDQYAAKGGTALYDALALGMERLQRVQGRRAVVVLTDGRDENDAGTAAGSVRPFPEIQRLAFESGVTLFAIGMGPNVDRERLTQLTTATGGLALFPADAAALNGDYQRIIENLRRRYVLSYTSTNPERDGKWRAVTIDSTAPDTIVRSRGGYYAPEDGARKAH